jgi:hypothetical protein
MDTTQFSVRMRRAIGITALVTLNVAAITAVHLLALIERNGGPFFSNSF